MERYWLQIGLGVALLTTACGDKESKQEPKASGINAPAPAVAAPPAPAAQLPPPPPPGVPVPGAPVAAPPPTAAAPTPGSFSGAEWLEAVNEALGTYVKEQDEYPKGVEDLIRNRYLRTTPKAPPGQKFHFDPEKKTFVLIPSGK
jgi:hypothetical protein